MDDDITIELLEMLAQEDIEAQKTLDAMVGCEIIISPEMAAKLREQQEDW